MDINRIKSRGLPSVPFRLLVVDGEQLAAAMAKDQEAAARLRQAILRHDPEKPDRVKELAAAKRARAKTEKAVAACWETIRLTALPPDEFEELKAACPPTAEELKADAEAEWSKAALRPALLASCAEGGLSVEEWGQLLAERFSKGERQDIFTTALAINESTRVVESVVLPKGSTGTNSLLSSLR
jgi:hypothetical protein